jgi:hypothetical protein
LRICISNRFNRCSTATGSGASPRNNSASASRDNLDAVTLGVNR